MLSVPSGEDVRVVTRGVTFTVLVPGEFFLVNNRLDELVANDSDLDEAESFAKVSSNG